MLSEGILIDGVHLYLHLTAFHYKRQGYPIHCPAILGAEPLYRAELTRPGSFKYRNVSWSIPSVVKKHNTSSSSIPLRYHQCQQQHFGDLSGPGIVLHDGSSDSGSPLLFIGTNHPLSSSEQRKQTTTKNGVISSFQTLLHVAPNNYFSIKFLFSVSTAGDKGTEVPRHIGPIPSNHR